MSNPTHTEQWRAVPGYEGFYEVSDHGRVRSLDRTVVTSNGRTRHYKGKVRHLHTRESTGYRMINLRREGKQTTRTVHSLVAEAFLGPRPEGHHTCHNDGNPANNHISNLRYDTVAGNQADRLKHGTHQRGDRGPGAKLDWPQVREIRARYATGCVTQQELADIYNVTFQNIHCIVNFKTWTHDPQETP